MIILRNLDFPKLETPEYRLPELKSGLPELCFYREFLTKVKIQVSDNLIYSIQKQRMFQARRFYFI